MLWWYVHPARGVVDADPLDSFAGLAPEDWHPEGEEAQAKAEDEFLATLIEYFAVSGATFEADLPIVDDQVRLQSAARAAGLAVEPRKTGLYVGALHPALVNAFPAKTQLVLSVFRDGAERLHIHDDIRQTFAQLEKHVKDQRDSPVSIMRIPHPLAGR